MHCLGGGALIETGTKEFAGELHHEQPLVYSNGTAVIILYGFLSNLEELFRWIETDKGAGSCSSSYGLGGSLSSRRFQSQSHAAEALLEVYSQTRSNDHLIMLSELQVSNQSIFMYGLAGHLQGFSLCLFAIHTCLLQGQYAFVIYDSSKKQAFAARDPGGQQMLYFSVDEDGSASFVNKPISVPGGEAFEDWQEVPPGHFVAGKTPKLQQFALTPQQLFARHSQDSADDEVYMHQSYPIAIKSRRRNDGMSSPSKAGEDQDHVFSMSF